MKTPNFDKQAEKFLINPVKKLKKNINVTDVTGNDVPYQLLRIKQCQMLLCSLLSSKCLQIISYENLIKMSLMNSHL